MPVVAPAGSQTLRVKFTFLPAQSLGRGQPKKIGFALYWQSPVSIGAGGIAAFKAAMDAQLGPPFKAAASVALPAPTIIIRDLGRYDNPDVIFAVGANGAYGPGAVAGDSLPWSQCANFEKLSPNSGKMNRGQLFIPGVPETGNQEGVLTVAQRALYNALGTAYVTVLAAGGQNFLPQIFSPTMSNLKLGNAGVWTQVCTGMDLDDIVTGLKRRKPKAAYE